MFGHLLRKVWFIGDHTSSKFISDVTVRMSVSTWAKNERVFALNSLSIVSRGLVGRGGHLLSKGSVTRLPLRGKTRRSAGDWAQPLRIRIRCSYEESDPN